MNTSEFLNKTNIIEIREKYDNDLETGSATQDYYIVAGRILLRRLHGKIAFATIQDQTGSIQLFFANDATRNFSDCQTLNLGDWIGAKGNVMKTKKGELSLKVEEFEVLARARRNFGDKFHGVTDPDIRFRHREMDLFANPETREAFDIRIRTIANLRKSLESRKYVEVETPILNLIPGGALAKPFKTRHNALDADMYLRIAPELYLKRLVVGGYERVYEIGRVFRNEGISPRHNPEFTALEMYTAYADYNVLMVLFEEILREVIANTIGNLKIQIDGLEIDFEKGIKRVTLSEAVSNALGEEVNLDTSRVKLLNLCEKHSIPTVSYWGTGKLLLELYEKLAEPYIVGPMFVTDYPAEVSPLALPKPSDPRYVERFELVVTGKELANAFSELNDPDLQREKFLQQMREKELGDEEAMQVDEDFLEALEYGLPPTAGLGLGVDRFCMLLSGKSNIREIIFFPTLKPENK